MNETLELPARVAAPAPVQELILRTEVIAPPEVRMALARPAAAAVAADCVVDCADMAELANAELVDCKAAAKQLDAMRLELVRPLNAAVATVNGWFRATLEDLGDAEQTYNLKLGAYKVEQKRLADEAERRAAAIARQARADAEAKAAADRARAEAEAAEKRRQAAAAEEARRRAEAEGNAAAAAAAAAKAAKLESEATAKTDAAEARAVEGALAVEASLPAVVVPAAPKLAGLTTRENWVAELAEGFDERRALLAVVQAIAGGRTDLLGLLALDMRAATALAKAQKSHMQVPGLVAVDRPIVASRAARSR
jgi:hypothetical protein